MAKDVDVEVECEKASEVAPNQQSKMPVGVVKYSTSYIVQSYFNAANHIMNGAVACFMTLYLFRQGHDSFAWHVYLTTIGYQLLMAEAIMVYYAPNSWSYFLSHKAKKHFHWILQVTAATFIITGNVVISVIRTTPHFETVHAITGLISMILMVISMLQGIWAYYAFELRALMKPIKSKFLHNVHSMLCFVIGMISLITGYSYGSTHDLFETSDIEKGLISFAVITMCLTLVGGVMSAMRFFKKTFN